MLSEPSLAPPFAAVAFPGSEAPADIEPRLQALVATARESWPALDLAPATFVQHLAARAREAESIDAYLRGVHAADLYLACAVQCGSRAAATALDRLLAREMPVFLRRLRPSPAFADEVRQALCEKLLVAPPGATPKIAGYSGSGPLGAWLRVAAVRTALNLQRGKQEEAMDTERAALAIAGDAEIEYIRSRYGDAMHAAVREAFGALPARQRAVLRLRFVDGLTDEKIGAVYGVHQTTVTRWVAAARETVMQETRRRLREQLGVGAAELESLAGVLRSRLDLSLSTLLGPG